MLGVILVLLPLVDVVLAHAQAVLKENSYYLRVDRRLQVRLNVEARHPKLSHILARLSEATGLEMTVTSQRQDHEPDVGHIQPSKKGYYAWQLMELVARKELQQGYWEKNSDGYRLTGRAIEAAPPVVAASQGKSHFIPGLIVLALVQSAVLLILILLRRKTNSVSSAEEK
jgi:hypothetical protein